MSIRLVVGLGNPGLSYEKTRHNVGFWFVDLLTQQYSCDQKLRFESKFKGDVTSLHANDHPCHLLKPQTYMNESGQSVVSFMRFYKIKPAAILVTHDELDFPAGTAYLKFAGGHGGHNGLRNIIQHIGADFWRLRIGIGHPGNRDLVHDYVLSRPSVDQKERMIDSMHQVTPLIPNLLAGQFEQVMNQLHTESK